MRRGDAALGRLTFDQRDFCWLRRRLSLIKRYPPVSNPWSAAAAVGAVPRRISDRRWRTFVIVFLALAGVLARPDNVRAQGHWEWAPLGVGCARAISVGPNGVPWILGCPGGDPNATGPAWVYYLTWSYPPDLFFAAYQWNYDNFSAMTLYVNLNGVPFATDIFGNVWWEELNSATGDWTGTEEPSGVWGLAASCSIFPGLFELDCVGAIAVGVNREISQPAGEMFFPNQWSYYYPGDTVANAAIYGVGCPTLCWMGPFTYYSWYQALNSSIWQAELAYIQNYGVASTPWSSLPGSATAITMFTTPGGSLPTAVDVRQTPWALTASGDVYSWQLAAGQWVQVPFPEPAISISDGAVLGQSGTLYLCVDFQCWGGNPSSADWNHIYPTSNGVFIQLRQAATGGVISQAVIGGPSGQNINSLPPTSPIAWAIDIQGNIYYAQYVSTEPSQ